MLSRFSELAFLHQKVTQSRRQHLGAVSKASKGTTFEHVSQHRKEYSLGQESIEMIFTVNIICRDMP